MQLQPSRKIIRKRSRGANLAILCAMAVMIIAFMGISIYSGLQAFLESDLQRASMNAALAGASAYYGTVGAGGKPSPNPGGAQNIATSVFGQLASNSSLGGFGATIDNVTNNDANDSITVNSQVRLATPLLAPIGISAIETNASATARALKYDPTQFTGPIEILPETDNLNSYSRVLDLAFPMVDGPGNDLYVEQDATQQMGYIVEACNDTSCYNLVPGATPVGSSQILTVNGVQAIYGTAIIDMAGANVRKANKLRFTHANQYDVYNAGALADPPTEPTPTTIQRVFIFGYAGACVNANACSIPAGFSPVE